MLDKDDPDRQSAMLTPDQRQGMMNNWCGMDRKQRSYLQRATVSRVENSLRDFRLLEEHLSSDRRDEIFDVRPGMREHDQLQRDVQAAIAFMYAGLGGESGFREPLRWGVADGEVALGNVEHHLDIQPRFAVDVLERIDDRAVAEAVENEEWDRLSAKDVFTFIKLAARSDAIDFEQIYERLKFEDEQMEWAESVGEENDDG